MTAGSGPREKSRPSWRPSSGSPRSPSSAAGRRCARSAGRSRGHGPATPARRPPRRSPRSKKAPRGRCRGGGAPSQRGDRDLRHRRAPRRSRPIAGRHRAQADPAPRLGAASGRRAGSGRQPSAITASSGSTSPPSPRPPPARASGPSRPPSPSATSRTCWPSSPARRARGAIGSSSWCSTTPDGTGHPGLPCPRASASSIFHPTPPSSSRPRRCGPTSTSRSSTGTSTPSPKLDAAVARQCVALNAERDRVKGQAGFHWWPARVSPN